MQHINSEDADDTILGDIDAWFESFERGDFCVEWEKQHTKMAGKQYEIVYCDASLD